MREETEEQAVGYYPMLRVLLLDLLIQSVRLIGLQVPERPGIEVSWILEEIRRTVGISPREYRRQRPAALLRML